MGEKVPSWQKRSKLVLDQLFQRKQFIEDLKLVKTNSMGIADLLDKYSIPSYAVGYISNYLRTGEKRF